MRTLLAIVVGAALIVGIRFFLQVAPDHSWRTADSEFGTSGSQVPEKHPVLPLGGAAFESDAKPVTMVRVGEMEHVVLDPDDWGQDPNSRRTHAEAIGEYLNPIALERSGDGVASARHIGPSLSPDEATPGLAGRDPVSLGRYVEPDAVAVKWGTTDAQVELGHWLSVDP